VNAVDILKLQLVQSCKLIEDGAANAEPIWTKRAFAGASLPGFVEWHCARIVDWGVHTVVRDVPEVAADPQWRGRVRYDMGHGAGLGAAEADSVAESVRHEAVMDYARAVRSAIVGWLDDADSAELDEIPDLRGRNQDHPLYRTPAAWEEIKGLEGVPAWQILTRPCISHIRVHSGEVNTLAQLLRA